MTKTAVKLILAILLVTLTYAAFKDRQEIQQLKQELNEQRQINVIQDSTITDSRIAQGYFNNLFIRKIVENGRK